MAYTFGGRKTVWWPIEVAVPSDDGSGRKEDVEVQLQYRLLSQSEIQELYGTGDETGMLARAVERFRTGKDLDRLAERVTGWRGVEDQDGQPIEFSTAKFRQACDDPHFYRAAMYGLLKASAGAGRKNS